jgi:hypothetical protein
MSVYQLCVSLVFYSANSEIGLTLKTIKFYGFLTRNIWKPILYTFIFVVHFFS